MPATQYHTWCNLKPGEKDLEFAEAVRAYLDHLKAAGYLLDWRLSRRKLGLGGDGLGEFHIVMEFADMGRLDALFEAVSARVDPIEGLHHAVNAKVRDLRFALYRDFPDPQRQTGQERF